MPFVYGQGLHDASWLFCAFGGNRYKTDMEVTAVLNLPEDQAALIYNRHGGYPIIIY